MKVVWVWASPQPRDASCPCAVTAAGPGGRPSLRPVDGPTGWPLSGRDKGEQDGAARGQHAAQASGQLCPPTSPLPRRGRPLTQVAAHSRPQEGGCCCVCGRQGADSARTPPAPRAAEPSPGAPGSWLPQLPACFLLASVFTEQRAGMSVRTCTQQVAVPSEPPGD